MFQDNRYRRIYDALIARARTRILSGYSERHHILPKSLGGTLQKTNLVRLTPREHYVAHLCLVRCTTGGDAQYKMAQAIRCFKYSKNYQHRVSSRMYANARLIIAERMKGNVPANKGKQISEETREKIRAARKRQGSPIQKGTRFSAETRAKMSLAHRGPRGPYKNYRPRPKGWKTLPIR